MGLRMEEIVHVYQFFGLFFLSGFQCKEQNEKFYCSETCEQKIFLVDILLKENRLAFMNKCKRENRENINPALFNQFGPSVFRCKKQKPGLYFNWAWTDEIYLVVLETSTCVFS